MLEKRTVSQCISSDYCRGWNDAVDAVVLCCECDYHDHDGATGFCNYWGEWSNMSDYCNHVKRKGGDE